jgi:hypothetical protein
MKSFKSSDITRLITLLEDKNALVRKMTLLALVSILTNLKSRVFFTEKCGLVSKNGKVFLSRLKYLKFNLSSDENSVKVLKYLIMEKSKNDFSNSLFWFVDLKNLNNLTSQNLADIKYNYFDKKDIQVNNGMVNFTSIPDPIYSLCGIEINLSKELTMQQSEKYIQQNKSRGSNLSKTSHNTSKIARSKTPVRSKSPMIRDMKSPSITRRANEFMEKNHTKMNKKFLNKSKQEIEDGKKSPKVEKPDSKIYRTAKSTVKNKGIFKRRF